MTPFLGVWLMHSLGWLYLQTPLGSNGCSYKLHSAEMAMFTSLTLLVRYIDKHHSPELAIFTNFILPGWLHLQTLSAGWLYLPITSIFIVRLDVLNL